MEFVELLGSMALPVVFLVGSTLGIKIGSGMKKVIVLKDGQPFSISHESAVIRPPSIKEWSSEDEEEDTMVEFPKEVKKLVFELVNEIPSSSTNDEEKICPETVRSPGNKTSSGVESRFQLGNSSSENEIPKNPPKTGT